MMTFSGIQREGIEVFACGEREIPVKNMTMFLYNDLNVALRHCDIIDVPDAFYTFTQHALAHHDNVFASIWDNLPYAKSRGAAGSLLMKAKKVICRSEMAAETMIWEGIPAKKIVVIPAGVDTELFHPLESLSQSQMNKIQGRKRVLYAARIVQEKGLWDLIVAMKKLDAELWIAGMGDISPYMDLAERVGVDIQYYGPVAHSSVAELMRQCHVFVNPCIPIINVQDMYADWNPQFEVAIIEAMASGVPVVASNVGAIPEIIRDGQTGILIPPRSWHELHYALDALLGDDKLREQMGNQAREVAEKEFSSLVVGNALYEIYCGGLT